VCFLVAIASKVGHTFFIKTERHKAMTAGTSAICTKEWSREIEALGQFHQYFTRVFLVQKFVQSQTLSREKLLKRCVRKILMKFHQPFGVKRN
jgi:hypothetical protein